MGKTLYIESFAGISGDMAVAALIDLGAPFDEIERVLLSLHLEGFSVSYETVEKSGIAAGNFTVHLDAAHENHDADMEYLHGHEELPDSETTDQGSRAQHPAEINHGHPVETAHSYHDRAHAHTHRHLREVCEIIDTAETSDDAKVLAKKIFAILAEAEGKVHGVSAEEVHFHEVGALDSIADILAFAVAFHSLDITEVIVPRLTEGRGTVRCQHGILPIPVPATAAILNAHHIPLTLIAEHGEFITPTGAAIAAAICTTNTLPDGFQILKIGLGAGKRNYKRASILRMLLIEPNTKTSSLTDNDDLDIGTVYKLETNIDDCTGEALGFTMDALFAAGAYDVHYVPVYMKKNRPGIVLYVICSVDLLPTMERIIYENTTTIGIRRLKMERSCLNRTLDTVTTSLGEVRIKRSSGYGHTRISPEYESVKAICSTTGKGFTEVYEQIIGELQ